MNRSFSSASAFNAMAAAVSEGGRGISVIIPARDEEEGIALVLKAIPHALASEVIVVDNGSRDGTAEVARSLGAKVVEEPRRGYGRACLAGLRAMGKAEVAVFLDGDYSDFPEEMPRLVAPILRGESDLVIGSRERGKRERGALPLHARLGNLVATWLIRMLYGYRYTDLGPFRAIRVAKLRELGMCEPSCGWTAEMQIRALKRGLRIMEVPASYRRRIGRSKVSGTFRGSARAGVGIIATILRLFP